jgi:soluble lytic murein transglycosylase-like protein
MSVATNSSVLAPIAWVEIARDVRDGALALARLVVSAAGFATLVLAAVALTNDGLRHTLKAALFTPTVLASEVVAGESGTTAVDEVANKTIDPAVAADPRQKHIVQYLARRYRVAEEATRMLVATAFQVGREQKLDPLLILSVVAIESSLNPFAESSMGAQGLMQVMTRIHAERFEAHGGQLAALDPVANMKVGSAILGDLINRGGSVERGLQLYVGAGNLPDDGGYGARVLGERARLALAASGKVDAAISAGRTAVASEQKPTAVEASIPAAAQPVVAPAADGPIRSEEHTPAREA